MASKTRRRAVALWAALLYGDLSADEPEPLVEPGDPIPLGRVQDAIKTFCDVSSTQATRPYLEEMELNGLIDWHRGGQGTKDPGFVVFNEPEGTIPFLRPPCVVQGNKDPVWTPDNPRGLEPETEPLPTAPA